jgi:DNA-binding transcriptional LysR family regulator
MEHFNDLAAFVAVVREGSFTRAAAQLGVSQSALSHTIRALEQRLELKLLNRTTRSVSPTDEGERLYQTVAPRFADIESELTSLRSLRGAAVGTVRITATEHAARALLLPKLLPLLAEHPAIKIEINSDNRFTDIVANRFDIGVRLGSDVAKDMIAARIAPDMRMRVAGSPAYLARAGRPQTPQALLEHNCIAMRLPTHGGLLSWEFMRDGKTVSVNTAGQLVVNDSRMIVDAALAGCGLAWLPEDLYLDHIDSGRLEPVLDDWMSTYPGYHVYYASRGVSQAVRLVVEGLRVGGR